MEIVDLRYLVTCAEAGTLTLAAANLCVETSTISRRISSLEDELGLSLFERNPTGIRLTHGGRAVLRHARHILLELDAMKRAGYEYARGKTGELRLGVRYPPIAGAARDLLAGWCKSNPDVALTVAEGNQRELALALKEHRLDAALVTGHAIWPHISAVPIFRERMFAALPMEHALAGRSSLDWQSLCLEVILVQGWEDNQSQREFYTTLVGSGSHFQVHAVSKETIFALVSIGAGIALATESQSATIIPGVVFKPIDEPNAWVDFGLAWLPEAEDPIVGRFVAFMRDESRARNLL